MFYRYLMMLFLAVILVSGCASAPAVSKPDAAEKESADEAGKDEKSSPSSKKYMEGLMAMNHGRWEAAEKHFLEALALNPKSYNSHIYLARVYENTDQKRKAIEQYRAAIKLKKDAYPAYYGLTGVYLAMGLPAYAAKACEEALENGVPEALVSTDLGWSYYLAGDLQKAEERLRTAKRLVEKDTAPRHDLGLALFSIGKYEEALENFQEVSDMNPESLLMPYYIALTYSKLGREDKALDALREGIKKDPELPKKAPFYNKKFFPHTDPGDLTPYFEKLEGDGQAK